MTTEELASKAVDTAILDLRLWLETNHGDGPGAALTASQGADSREQALRGAIRTLVAVSTFPDIAGAAHISRRW